jgi:general secretion pathway protein H
VKHPISETGTSTPSLCPSGNLKQAGYTLWELLVVVAIIAITVSVVQLSVSLGDENRELKRIGKDLGKLFHLLSQEAVFENRNYAVSVHDEGFVILEYQDGEWLETGESFLRRFKMTDSQSSQLYLEEKLVNTEKKTEPPPHILILSSGEMTPFEWRITDRQTNAGIVLQGNLLGSVLMTGPEPIS